MVTAMAVAATGLAAFLLLIKPDKVSPPAIKVAMTAEKIEREVAIYLKTLPIAWGVIQIETGAAIWGAGEGRPSRSGGCVPR